MDFVLRCAEHEVLQKFPNTGLEYSYRIPGHCSTREQRSIYGLSGTQRLKMILHADDIAVLSNNADELAEILRIYDKTFTRFGLKIATNKTKTMAFNVPEEIKSLPSLFIWGEYLLRTYGNLNTLVIWKTTLMMIHPFILIFAFHQPTRNGMSLSMFLQIREFLCQLG